MKRVVIKKVKKSQKKNGDRKSVGEKDRLCLANLSGRKSMREFELDSVFKGT